MARERKELEQDLVRYLGVSREEAALYLRVIAGEERISSKRRGDARERALIDSMTARGMLIMSANGGEFVSVHPRLALSNLFRLLGDQLGIERKERRLAVDGLTLEVLALFELGKAKNLGREEGPEEG